jgi:hypothetical protein
VQYRGCVSRVKRGRLPGARADHNFLLGDSRGRFLDQLVTEIQQQWGL